MKKGIIIIVMLLCSAIILAKEVPDTTSGDSSAATAQIHPEFPYEFENSYKSIGGYYNVDNFINNDSVAAFKFKVRKRWFPEILAFGGNDYKVVRRNFKIKKSVIRKELWGVYDGEFLYINNFPYTGVGQYYKLIPLDGMFYFLAANSRKNSTLDWFMGAGVLLGGIPGGINTMKRIAFEVDPETETVTIVTEDRINEILLSSPELLNEYNDHKSKSNPKVMYRYIEKIHSQHALK